MHGGPCGTVNLQNDHWLEKYFGIIDRPSFVFGASKLNTWMVPWSEETTIHVESRLKFMQVILA